MEKCLVSVIIPCYNYAHFLTEAVDSVIQQTYTNWECIIVDDGSTDNSAEIAKTLIEKDNRMRYVYQENQGLAVTRNKGFSESKGEFIQFLDADDLLDKNKLSEQVAILNANKEIDICYTNYQTFNSDTKELQGRYSTKVLSDNPLRDLLFKWERELSIPIHSALFKRSIFDVEFFKGKPFVEDMKAKEDWLMWIMLALNNNKFFFIDKDYALYRMHPGNMCKESNNMGMYFVRVVTKIYSLLNDEYKEEFLNESIKHLSLVYFSTRYNVFITQLYIDTGNGFNKEQSFNKFIEIGENQLEFELSAYSNIKSIRFDPVNDFALISIKKILLISEDTEAVEINDYIDNAFYREKNKIFFSTTNPQIYIHSKLLSNPKKIIIILDYLALGSIAYNYIIQVKDQQIADKTHLIDLNNSIHSHAISSLETQLSNIYSSRSWRMLQIYSGIINKLLPIGSIRRKLITRPLRIGFNLLKFIYRNNPYNVYKKSSHFLENIIKRKIIFAAQKELLVSIIIPVYNNWSYTYNCLKSIYDNTQGVLYEVIIVDDVSTDKTKNITKYIKNITVIRNEHNLGFLLNCNKASISAKGKCLLFLNNDTQVQKDWLKCLIELLDKDLKIGIAGSKLIYPDGRLQEAGGIIWKDASGFNYGKFDDPGKPEYNYVKESDYISGACILIRKELWQEIGGFDTRYSPAYYEDADLAFEIRKHGFKVMYQPKSVVVHYEGISCGTDETAGIKSYQLKNKDKFFEKWNKVLATGHFNNGENIFNSRDRSHDKKTILFIDHYVPEYDKNAGSRCTFHYMKIFVELGFNVKFVADDYIKKEPYTSFIEQIGIEVLYGEWYKKNFHQWFEKNGRYFHYIYLNRPAISIKYISLIKKYSTAKIFYFPVDLHYIRDRREYEINKNDALLNSAEYYENIDRAIIQEADVVHVAGDYECQYLQNKFTNKIIRNIPIYIYDNFNANSYKPVQDRNDILFVGGFDHPPNKDAVLWFVNDVFPKIQNKIPNINFYIVGSNPTDEIKRLQTKNIIVTGFVSDDQLKEYYNNTKLMVAPLRFGAGIKGKVIEAMYYKIPVITTPIGAEGLPGVEKAISVVSGLNEFSDEIIKLYQNNDLLEKQINSAYEYIKNNFSKKNALEILQADL